MSTQQIIYQQVTPSPLGESDAFIDFVVSGLVLPATSANLTGTLTTGTAYVIGQRLSVAATANTYTASKDTYVDLSNVGTLTYSAVGNGAGAPALTANSIRLGFVTTDGTKITGATTTGKDSLGNWMRNTCYSPSCVLVAAYNAAQSISNNTDTAATWGSAANEILDNDAMHSITTNNSRITVVHAGLYQIMGAIQYGNPVSASGLFGMRMNKNGVEIEGSESSTRQNNGDYPAVVCSLTLPLVAGDYVELIGNQVSGASQTMVRVSLRATRAG